MAVKVEIHPDENAYPGNDWHDMHNPGLSVRSEFAKAAMMGMLANPNIDGVTTHETIARWSVDAADCLIAELNKPKEVK